MRDRRSCSFFIKTRKTATAAATTPWLIDPGQKELWLSSELAHMFTPRSCCVYAKELLHLHQNADTVTSMELSVFTPERRNVCVRVCRVCVPAHHHVCIAGLFSLHRKEGCRVLNVCLVRYRRRGAALAPLCIRDERVGVPINRVKRGRLIQRRESVRHSSPVPDPGRLLIYNTRSGEYVNDFSGPDQRAL